MDPTSKQYVVIVQCHLATQRCSGYQCEKSFHERSSAFAAYGKDQPLRMVMMSCGGCSGRAVQRKVAHLLKRLKQHEGLGPERVVVHLSSCMALDNHHSPPCPNLEAIRTMLRSAKAPASAPPPNGGGPKGCTSREKQNDLGLGI
jgi:predicted metal-binding protein